MRNKNCTTFRDEFGEAIRRAIGQNIRKLRCARGVSQEELADRVRIPSRHLRRIEMGRSNVTINLLVAIAAELSVNVARLTPKRRPSAGDFLCSHGETL
jgi:transcriptional regulator with XRE-family HTH domain